MTLASRLGDRGHRPLLDQPAQRDLRRGLAVAFGDLGQDGMARDLSLGERHVGGEHHAVLARQPENPVLRQEGMVFDLVAGDVGAAFLHGLPHQGRVEVADPDEARLAGGLDLAEGLQGLAQRDGLARPVDEQQVDIAGVQVSQAVFGAAFHVRVREVVGPDLRRDEHVLPVDGRVPDGAAHLGLVAVHAGGVDMTVADIERHAHRVDALAPAQRPSAEAQRGNPDPFHVDVHRGRCLRMAESAVRFPA